MVVVPPPVVVEPPQIVFIQPVPNPPAPVVETVSPFFVDVLAGKDRRTRHADTLRTTDGHFVRPNGDADDYTQCSPLVGIKFGVAKKFDNLWEVAGTAGVALSVVKDAAKVRQNEYFTDFEVNKYTSKDGGFIGTGVTFWDVTHKDTWAPGVVAHFGIPVGDHPRHPVYVVGEGRVFFDKLGNISNNYQVWGGVRIH